MAIIPEGIFSIMAQRDPNNSPQEGGHRCRPEIYTDEEVITGDEGAHAIREFVTDWTELEDQMARMSVDDHHHGKILVVC